MKVKWWRCERNKHAFIPLSLFAHISLSYFVRLPPSFTYQWKGVKNERDDGWSDEWAVKFLVIFLLSFDLFTNEIRCNAWNRSKESEKWEKNQILNRKSVRFASLAYLFNLKLGLFGRWELEDWTVNEPGNRMMGQWEAGIKVESCLGGLPLDCWLVRRKNEITDAFIKLKRTQRNAWFV